MEINFEVITLVFGTLGIILGGFVVLYRKLSELEVITALLTERIGNMLNKVETIEVEVDDHDKRLNAAEIVIDKIPDLNEYVDNHEKRLSAVEIEHYTYAKNHTTDTKKPSTTQ